MRNRSKELMSDEIFHNAQPTSSEAELYLVIFKRAVAYSVLRI